MSVNNIDQIFELPIQYSPRELEWKQLPTAGDSGQTVLHRMANIGADLIQIENIRQFRSGHQDLIEFDVEGFHRRVSIDRSATATMLSGLRTLLDKINQGSLQAGNSNCFICLRDDISKVGTESRYYIGLVDRSDLRGISQKHEVIAGISPESFEFEAIP